MTDTSVVRIPKELEEFIKQEAERRKRDRLGLYEQLADELKGRPPLLEKRKKHERSPFEF